MYAIVSLGNGKAKYRRPRFYSTVEKNADAREFVEGSARARFYKSVEDAHRRLVSLPAEFAKDEKLAVVRTQTIVKVVGEPMTEKEIAREKALAKLSNDEIKLLGL